jgi:hypothetical protein
LDSVGWAVTVKEVVSGSYYVPVGKRSEGMGCWREVVGVDWVRIGRVWALKGLEIWKTVDTELIGLQPLLRYTPTWGILPGSKSKKW